MSKLHASLETLEHRWMRAWIAGDQAALKELTSRRFRLVVGSKPPVMLDRKSLLDAVANGGFVCTSYQFAGLYVRDVEGFTIFASGLNVEATIAGKEFSGDLWLTDLWRKTRVRRRWQLVERILSRPEERATVPAGVRALQLWR